MGPSRMMASSSSANSDLTGQSSASSHPASVGRSLGSISVEDLHRSIRGGGGGGGGSGGEGASLPLLGIGDKTEKEMRGEFAAHGRTDGFDAAITLEDFLTKAGVVLDGNAWIPPGWGQMDLGQGQVMGDRFAQPPQFPVENPVVRFGNGAEGVGMAGGRRKRPLLDPVDRAVAQRQKRMIKNRESAARSRERKQAYVAELESLVARLKADNAQLLKRLEDERMGWMKQLEKKMVPVTNMKRPRQPLRRSNSMEW